MPFPPISRSPIIAGLIALAVLLSPETLFAQQWNQYRGPDKTGAIQLGHPGVPLHIEKMVWEFQPERGSQVSPVVTGGKVIAGSGTSLYCLDREKGTLKWKFKYQELDRWPGQTSNLLVANNTVYFGSREGKFLAVDAENGKLKWEFPAGRMITSTPAMADNLIYFSGFDSLLYALNASTGEKVWTYNTKGGDASPIVANGKVYVGSGKGDFYAVSASDGKPVWTYKAKDRIYAAPVYSNGFVYFGSDDGHLYALHAETGKEEWIVNTKSYIFDCPTVYKDVVVITNYAGVIMGLNSRTGAEIWRKNYHVAGEPVIVNGVVIISTFDKTNFQYIRGLTYDTGEDLWVFSLEMLSGEPLIIGDWLYVSLGVLRGYKIFYTPPTTASKAREVKEVKLGSQTWATRNLEATAFANADPIPQARTHNDWQRALDEGKPTWCYYNFDEAYAAFGKMYNWYAVNDPRGLAPKGWHIPTYEEWETLFTAVGANELWDRMVNVNWWAHGLSRTSNSTGFGVVGGGLYGGRTFGGFGREIAFWSAAKDRTSIRNNSNLLSIHFGTSWAPGVGKVYGEENAGMYVRCVRD